jgi:ribosomal protein L40E
MSKAELMAKMTPHGVQITGMGFGGTTNLSALDVAGALGMGGLSHPAYLFGLLKYCGDHQVLGRLDRIVRGYVFTLGKAERWNLTDDQICGLSRLAVFENLHVRTCGKCNGSGTIAAKACDKCEGTGRLPMSNRQRATIAGIPETSFRREWKSRAQRCYGIVQNWESELITHLHKQLAEAA